jgi:hypothetical protein
MKMNGMIMKSVLVFCGSSSGFDRQYMDVSYALGKTLAERNISLVYGGANVGLMRSVADGALANGGIVTGVLPAFLANREVAHTGLTDLIIVETLHQRKQKMADLAQGAIALPGGFGTLDELFEFLTWGQLGLHSKPTGLLNINGFYDELLRLTHTMVSRGFLKEVNRKMILADKDIGQLLTQMDNYLPPSIGKWIEGT